MKTKTKTRNRRQVRQLKSDPYYFGGRKIRKEPDMVFKNEDILDEVAYSMLEDEEEQFASSWQCV